MKSYPSIPRSTGTYFREIPGAYLFDKVDGSNMRFEWSKKRGWFKAGTRERLVDVTDPVFGPAVPLFNETMAPALEPIIKGNRWDHLLVFCEFWGRKSFTGDHEPGDPKFLTIIDAVPQKRGFLGPRDFIEAFNGLGFPLVSRFLGVQNWTRGFVERVRVDDVEGISFEGVVAKAGRGPHDIVRAKAKTQRWIDAVRMKYGPRADAIIDS